jgi:hypothetical protein
MWAKRVDGNQAEVVSELRRRGWAVLHLHTVGKGCPDLLVSKRGLGTFLLEVKYPGEDTNDRQDKFISDWGSAGGEAIYVCESAEQFLRVIGIF